jgi:hypothetical protein
MVPIEAVAIPLPTPDMTAPTTKMNFLVFGFFGAEGRRDAAFFLPFVLVAIASRIVTPRRPRNI